MSLSNSIDNFYYHYNTNNTLRAVLNALYITIILIDSIYYTFDYSLSIVKASCLWNICTCMRARM